MFCPKCGKQVEEGYKFCDTCGTPMQESASPWHMESSARDVHAVPPNPMASMPPVSPALDGFADQTAKSGKAGCIAIVALLVVILGGIAYWILGRSSKTSNVDVAIAPSTITLAPGASATIEASVTGTQDVDVTWKVKEGAAGGTITPAGASAHDGHVYSAATYTAPGNRGVYHVIATSNADSRKAAGLTVRVR